MKNGSSFFKSFIFCLQSFAIFLIFAYSIIFNFIMITIENCKELSKRIESLRRYL